MNRFDCKTLLDEGTDTVTYHHNLIMKNLKSFYSILYIRKYFKTEKQCFEYLNEINTPVLTPEERELCEGQLTLNPITYGILRFFQLWGGGGGAFWPRPRKQVMVNGLI